MGQNFQLEKIFPLHIRDGLEGKNWQDGLEEIRVRIAQPVEFSYDTNSRYLALEGGHAVLNPGTGCIRGEQSHIGFP